MTISWTTHWISLDTSGLTRIGKVPRGAFVLVGARRDARRLLRRLGKRPWGGLPIVGFVNSGHSRSSSLRPRSRHLALHPETDPVPILGPVDRLDEFVDRARATHLMVAVSGEGEASLPSRMSPLTHTDVPVQWVSVDSGPLDLDSLGSRANCATMVARRNRTSQHPISPVGPETDSRGVGSANGSWMSRWPRCCSSCSLPCSPSSPWRS